MKIIIISFILYVNSLIPEFKQGTYNGIDQTVSPHILYSSTIPGRSLSQTVTFGYTFRDVPQVVIGFDKFDYSVGSTLGCKIEVAGVTKTQFVFTATELVGQKWPKVFIRWYAFNDDSIEIIPITLSTPALVIGDNTIAKTKSTNVGALMLTGFQYNCNPDFKASITTIAETSFIMKFQSTNSCVQQISYIAVMGNSMSLEVTPLASFVPNYTYDFISTSQTYTLPAIWQEYDEKIAFMAENGFKESASKNGRLFFTYSLVGNDVKYQIIYVIKNDLESDLVFPTAYVQCGSVTNYMSYYQIILYRPINFDLSCKIIDISSLPHVQITVN